MPHPVNRRQMPGWKQARRPPAPPKIQGGFAKQAARTPPPASPF